MIAELIEYLPSGERVAIQGECYLVLSMEGVLAHLDTGRTTHWTALALWDDEVEVLVEGRFRM